jgi:hypothetical protein
MKDLTNSSQIKLNQMGYTQQAFKSIDHSQIMDPKKK